MPWSNSWSGIGIISASSVVILGTTGTQPILIQIGPGPTATWYGQNGSQIVITADQSLLYPTIQFWNANHNNMAFINMYGSNSDANLGINSGGFPSIRYPSITNAQVTELLTTAQRSFEARIESAPAQVPYGGSLIANETISQLRLLDQTSNVRAASGVFDNASSGAVSPVAFTAVDAGGVYVDTASIQLKNNINENYPVELDRTSRWLVVAQFDWTALILINLWAPVNTYLTPAAKMMPDGVVVLAGTIGGGNTADNTQAFATPFTSMAPTASALLRPATSVGNANARILVNASGQGFIYGIAAGSQLGLDGLSFRTVRPGP